MSLVGRFMAANRRLCRRVERFLPTDFRPHMRTIHRDQVANLLNERPGQVVLDVGAGRTSAFLPLVAERDTHLIIAMDLSEVELRCNPELTAKVVADAAASGFPLRDNSVDVLASHQVVEHIADAAVFFGNCANVLRPGGRLAHTFACKFAPFALINQLIPNWLARRLLGWLHPDWRQDAVGFPAFYNRCYFGQINRLLIEKGFDKATWLMDYYQAGYFDFFFPLYLAMLTCDLVTWYFGIRNLAGGIMVVAQKKAKRRLADGDR